MNYIDIAIVAIIVISLLISVRRGIVKEVVSLATWILSIFCVLNYAEVLAKSLTDFISNPPLRILVGVVLIILGIFILGKIINKILGAIIADSWFGPFDKIIGIAFGVCRGVILVAIIIVAVNMLNINYSSYKGGSSLLSPFEDIAQTLHRLVDDNYDGLKNSYFKMSTNYTPEINTTKKSAEPYIKS
jgi:membrane protein required for colicin V production